MPKKYYFSPAQHPSVPCNSWLMGRGSFHPTSKKLQRRPLQETVIQRQRTHHHGLLTPVGPFVTPKAQGASQGAITKSAKSENQEISCEIVSSRNNNS